jgi:hypothetical protein
MHQSVVHVPVVFNGEPEMKSFGIFLACVAAFGSLVVALAAQITHVIICIKAQAYLLLIAGFFVAPVGIIHGIGHWVGAW